MNFNYIGSIPGILKIVTIAVGLISSIISFIALGFNKPIKKKGGRQYRSYGIQSSRSVKASVYGLPLYYQTTCGVIPKDTDADDFALSMAVIWFLLSFANLAVFIFIVKRFSEKLVKIIKLIDIIGHVTGGVCLVLAGAEMLYFANSLHACDCLDETPEDVCINNDSFVKYGFKVATGVFVVLNGLIFFVVAVVIFVGGGAPVKRRKDHHREFGNHNSQNPTMVQEAQPTSKESNQVIDQPPPIEAPIQPESEPVNV